MQRRNYVKEGAEQGWNVVADEDFDPNAEEYAAPDSPIHRAGRGRGSGSRGRRGRGASPGGRGAHAEGVIVNNSQGRRGQGRGGRGSKKGSSAGSIGFGAVDPNMGLMGSPFPTMPGGCSAAIGYGSSYQYPGHVHAQYMFPLGTPCGGRNPSPLPSTLHAAIGHAFAAPNNTQRSWSHKQLQRRLERNTCLLPYTPKLGTLNLRLTGGTAHMLMRGGSVIPPHPQNSGFKVPATPRGSRNVQKPREEAIDLEVRKLLTHNARRAENRRLHKDFEEQVRFVQETGGAPIIRLRTNSAGEVCELRTKWHAAIKSLCARYLWFSIRNFDEQDKKLVRCIIDTMNNKMFRYEPYALRDDAVKDFLQSYLNTSRSRYKKFWVAHGCDDQNPHPSTSPGDWYECCRFWRSEEGKQVSESMTAVRACVGKTSQSSEVAPCHREEFMRATIGDESGRGRGEGGSHGGGRGRGASVSHAVYGNGGGAGGTPYSDKALTTYLRGSYCTYDEFSFWWGECRRDHDKMREQIADLIASVEALRLELGKASPPASPAGTPTQILENGYSPDILSRPTRPSEWMASVAMLGAPGLRQLPCTDLSKHFEDMDRVTHTQILDGVPNATFTNMKSPTMQGRGPKGLRGSVVPVRDPAMTPSSSQPVVKRTRNAPGAQESEISMPTGGPVMQRPHTAPGRTSVAEKMPIWDKFLMGKGRASTGPSCSTATVVEDCPEVDDDCEEVRVLEVRTTPRTTYPKGSFVDLLHPDHDTKAVGKGRLGKPCPIKGAARDLYTDGAQYVTVTEAMKSGVALPLDCGMEPPLSSLDEAVGYQIPWPVLHLQVRVRGSEAHS